MLSSEWCFQCGKKGACLKASYRKPSLLILSVCPVISLLLVSLAVSPGVLMSAAFPDLRRVPPLAISWTKHDTLFLFTDFWFSKTPGFIPRKVSPQPRANIAAALKTLLNRRRSFCGCVVIFLYKSHSHSHLNGQFFLEKKTKIPGPWDPKDHNQLTLRRGVEDTIHWPPFPPFPTLTELCLCRFIPTHSL